jgi:spermidine synthase
MVTVKLEIIKSAPSADIENLYREAGWWDQEKEISETLIPKIIQGSFCFAVAKHDGKIVGMARALSDGVSDAYIHDVTVLKAYRSQKIGRRLVQLVIEECQKSNIGWIGLVAKPGTLPFYQAIGFQLLEGFQLALLESSLS